MASVIVIVILSVAAAGILSYSLSTYRNSQRQIVIDQAKVIADSEMENLYFQWKNIILMKQTTIGSVTSTAPLAGGGGLLDPTNVFPFLRDPSTTGWTVTRTLQFKRIGTGDGSATGIMPNTINQIGKNYYFTAMTSASKNVPLLGTITYHSGRHFQYSSTSLFQFAVFYEGNLEMAPGSNMLIQGPIATNASAYLGTLPGITLTLASNVYYFQNYNGAPDPLTGETDAIISPGSYNDPVYNPNPLGAAPNQAAERALQVSQLTNQANFVGDVNVSLDISTTPPSPYLAAYTNQVTHQVDVNEIYRAVVAPPPLDPNPPYAQLTEDPLVKASRMYNAAGVLITIDANATPPYHVGGLQSDGTINTTLYDGTFGSTIHQGGASTTDILDGTIRQSVADPRETLNGKSGVNLTTLNVGNLTAALATAMVTDPNLAANYNGVVYVYDKTDNTQSGQPANSLNGIRIKNATTTPVYNDPTGNPLGFSIVSDNGVYVQGDYNTANINVGGVRMHNPSGIMGDAVTAVSQDWDPTVSSHPIGTGADHTRWADASTIPVGAQFDTHPAGMEIDAAILTGNTPTNTTVTPNIKSGGAQNLVRLIEDWYSPTSNLQLTVNGSLGQLFSSKYFQGPWVGTTAQAGLGGDKVYVQPHLRNFTYDLNFQSHTPAGSPTTTSFHKGDFFFW